MNGVHVAATQLSHTVLIGFALIVATCGGYTTVRAAEVVRERTGTRRTLQALAIAACAPAFRTRDFWIAVSDCGAMAIIICLVILFGLDQTNPIAPAILSAAILVQGGWRLWLFLLLVIRFEVEG
jgi:hypothetical protein